VGLVSRSGTLTYQVVDNLTERGIGQTTAIGIGGDPIIGTSFVDALEAFENDPETEAVVMCGEIGGEDEERAARFVRDHMDTPVVGFIAGRTAPPGKRMGHAGAIVSGSGTGTAASKIEALNDAGVPVGDTPEEVGPCGRTRPAGRVARSDVHRPRASHGRARADHATACAHWAHSRTTIIHATAHTML
jgi:succinyl-CoA synthetase alpha subunit